MTGQRFVERAPTAVVAKERERMAAVEERLTARLKELG